MDGARTVVNLLIEKWNPENVGETPDIKLVYDLKRVDLIDKSTVLIYQVNTNETINSIGATTKEVVETVTIDIRTTVSRDRLIEIEKEVRRILETHFKNITDAVDTKLVWDLVAPSSSIDRSDKSIKLYRYTMDVNLTAFATRRPPVFVKKPKQITVYVAHDNKDVLSYPVELYLCDEVGNQIKSIANINVVYKEKGYESVVFDIDTKNTSGVWYYVEARPAGYQYLVHRFPIFDTTTGGYIVVRAIKPRAGKIQFVIIDVTSENQEEWSLYVGGTLNMTILKGNDTKTLSFSVPSGSIGEFALNPDERILRIEVITNRGNTIVSAVGRVPGDIIHPTLHGLRVTELSTKLVFLTVVKADEVPVSKFRAGVVVVPYPPNYQNQPCDAYLNGNLAGRRWAETIAIKIGSKDYDFVGNKKLEFDISGDENDVFIEYLVAAVGGYTKCDTIKVTATARYSGLRMLQYLVDYNNW